MKNDMEQEMMSCTSEMIKKIRVQRIRRNGVDMLVKLTEGIESTLKVANDVNPSYFDSQLLMMNQKLEAVNKKNISELTVFKNLVRAQTLIVKRFSTQPDFLVQRNNYVSTRITSETINKLICLKFSAIYINCGSNMRKV